MPIETAQPEPTLRDEPVAPVDPTARRRQMYLLVGAFASTMAIWWGIWVLAVGGELSSRWIHVVTPIGILALIVLLVVYRQRHWVSPLKHFEEKFELIRSGQAPIDELGHVKGGIEPLVPIVQELFRDLKRAKAQVLQLNMEMSTKVANRTDAMERKINALRSQASKDALTGLFNRRMLDELLPQMMQKSLQQEQDLAVLMIDVDFFKPLNDTLGHAAGDEFLKSLGHIIRSTVRAEDAAFRCGGDEFVIVLPGTSEAQATAMVQRLKALADQLAKPLRLPNPPKLSIGAAQMSEADKMTPQLILANADKSLYVQKRDKRKSPAPPTTSARKAG